jgi:hypothetical protein
MLATVVVAAVGDSLFYIKFSSMFSSLFVSCFVT